MTTPDVDQELERLFSAARAGTVPEAGAKARIRAALEPRIASGGTALAFKRPAWLGLGAAVIGLCAGALWLTSTPRASEPPSRSSVPAPRAVTPEAPAVIPAPVLEAAPSASPDVVPAPKPRATPSLPAIKPAPSVMPEDSGEELTLVRAMQQALRSGNAGQALALADQHAQRFPRGTLAEEREGVRAVARCRLGAPSERATILEAFSRRFGSSPYAARVKQACQ
jgi:hypothetical protein